VVLMASWPSVTDDSGTKTDGTIFNLALTNAIKASIEDQCHSLTNTTVKPKTITDEVITARNGQPSLSARLALLGGADQVITGGLIVGYSGTPTADTIQIGDATFLLQNGAAEPIIYMDSTDGIGYNRGSNTFYWFVASTVTQKLYPQGLEITSGGLTVGFSGVPSADRVSIGDANFYLDINTASPVLLFDANDYLCYVRASNTYQFVVGGAVAAQVDAASVFIGADKTHLRLTSAAALQTINFTNNAYLAYDSTNHILSFTNDASGSFAHHSNGNFIHNNANTVYATTTTVGFVYIPSVAGTPTGVPTAFAGNVPMIFDTTGVKLWIYTGGAWKGVVVA
jgi:hypothetical protein